MFIGIEFNFLSILRLLASLWYFLPICKWYYIFYSLLYLREIFNSILKFSVNWSCNSFALFQVFGPSDFIGNYIICILILIITLKYSWVLYADLCSESLLCLSLLIMCSFSLIFECINISSLMIFVGFWWSPLFYPYFLEIFFFLPSIFLIGSHNGKYPFYFIFFQINNFGLVNSLYYVFLFY